MTKVRRSFSLPEQLSDAVDRVADETDTNKSTVVENALREYLDGLEGGSNVERVEKKVDQLLKDVDELKESTIRGDGGAALSSESPSPKKEKTREFSPEYYDPEADHDSDLTKDELRELISLDEPFINPDHVNDDNLPGGADEKKAICAGVVRYERSEMDGRVFPECVVDVIKEFLGGSDYYYGFKDDILSKFPVLETINDELEREVTTLRFITRDAKREFYRDNFESHKEALDDALGSRTTICLKAERWLKEFKDECMEAGVSEDEFSRVQEEYARDSARFRSIVSELRLLEDDYKADQTQENLVQRIDMDNDVAADVVDGMIKGGRIEETYDGLECPSWVARMA